MATHSSIPAWKIPIDKEAWQTAVQGVSKNGTQMSDWAHRHARLHAFCIPTSSIYSLEGWSKAKRQWRGLPLSRGFVLSLTKQCGFHVATTPCPNLPSAKVTGGHPHDLHAQSCLTLWGPMDCSLPGSSVHGMLQTRTLEWVALPSSRSSSQPRDWTRVCCVSCLGRLILYHECRVASPLPAPVFWELDSVPWEFGDSLFEGNIPTQLFSQLSSTSSSSSAGPSFGCSLKLWSPLTPLSEANIPSRWPRLSPGLSSIIVAVRERPPQRRPHLTPCDLWICNLPWKRGACRWD